MSSRYEDANILTGVTKVDSDGNRRTIRRLETTIYPNFDELFADDTYILTQENDRLDILAKEFYGDEVFWHVIAKANNIGKGTLMVPPGIILRIPYYDDYAPISSMIRDRNTRR